MGSLRPRLLRCLARPCGSKSSGNFGKVVSSAGGSSSLLALTRVQLSFLRLLGKARGIQCVVSLPCRIISDHVAPDHADTRWCYVVLRCLVVCSAMLCCEILCYLVLRVCGDVLLHTVPHQAAAAAGGSSDKAGEEIASTVLIVATLTIDDGSVVTLQARHPHASARRQSVNRGFSDDCRLVGRSRGGRSTQAARS